MTNAPYSCAALRAHDQLAGLRAEAHRAAFFGHLLLLVQHGDDRMRRVGIEFRRMRLRPVSKRCARIQSWRSACRGKGRDRALVFARVLRRQDFAFDAAFAETAGHQDAAQALQHFFRAFAFDFLGVHLLDFHAAIVGDAAVDDRFVNRFVGVLQARCICRPRRCARGAAAR